jgi:hypothetical protein
MNFETLAFVGDSLSVCLIGLQHRTCEPHCGIAALRIDYLSGPFRCSHLARMLDSGEFRAASPISSLSTFYHIPSQKSSPQWRILVKGTITQCTDHLRGGLGEVSPSDVPISGAEYGTLKKGPAYTWTLRRYFPPIKCKVLGTF